jgi:hypothetical protein
MTDRIPNLLRIRQCEYPCRHSLRRFGGRPAAYIAGLGKPELGRPARSVLTSAQIMQFEILASSTIESDSTERLKRRLTSVWGSAA